MDKVNYHDASGETPFVGEWYIMKNTSSGHVCAVGKRGNDFFIQLKPGGPEYKKSDILGFVDNENTKNTYIPYPFTPTLIAARKIEYAITHENLLQRVRVEHAQEHVPIPSPKSMWSRLCGKK